METTALLKVESTDVRGREYLTDVLCSCLTHPFIVLCIGTDKSISDSLGPFCGMLLKHRSQLPVFGTLEKPVHRENLSFTMDVIRLLHPRHMILAVDAAYGMREDSGSVMLINDGIVAAGYAQEATYKAGDIALIGITDYPGSERDWLNKMRISTVYQMAEMISDAVIEAAAFQT
jgi:putative sporulation protein YyaC